MRKKTVFVLVLTLAAGAQASAQTDAAGMVIPFSDTSLQGSEIELAEAASRDLSYRITLPGEVKINADRLAHIVPRLNGVVREVTKSLGDTVSAGEVIVVLDSPELADAKAAYLAARERSALYQSLFEREERLYQSKSAPSRTSCARSRNWRRRASRSRRRCRPCWRSVWARNGSRRFRPGPPRT